MNKLLPAFRILSLPIEVKNREFLGKLLLAAKAADNGWAVLLGKQSRVCASMLSCPPGLHIEVSIPEEKYKTRILPLLDAGHRLACLCEEGIVYPDGSDYCQRKVGIAPLSKLSYYFANGNSHYDDILQHRSPPENCLQITGNPRFDLLHSSLRSIYDDKVREIRLRYGHNIILLNTNFSVVNSHPSYGDFVSRMRKSGRLSTPEQERLWNEFVNCKQRLFHDYRQLVSLLHRRGYTVVIRPHPSEDHAAWSSYTSAMERVYVVHDGSANAWMIAASVIVQSACTTGLEAFLLDRPLISYMPPGLIDDHSFVSTLGHPSSTLDEVLASVEFLSGQSFDGLGSPDRSLVSYHIGNVDQPFACDRIVSAICDLPIKSHDLLSIRSSLLASRRSSFHLFASRILRKVLSSMPSRFCSPIILNRQRRLHLTTQKFPGLESTELDTAIRKFQALGAVKKSPCIEKIDSDLYLIYPFQ